MAVAVIDGLEVVEIQLQQGQCFAVGLRQLELLLQLLAELPAIIEAGQVSLVAWNFRRCCI
jgi:hypothetical protein